MVDPKKAKKIVLMGLDDAGKSSILLSLQNDSRLSSYKGLPPTTKMNRGIVKDDKVDYTIFDFGGQEALRDDYLKNLDHYLEEVDKVIFVIDIKDVKRHDIAIDFLAKIVQYLGANPKPLAKDEVKSHAVSQRYVPVSIFLHKYDLLPGGKEDKTLEPIARDLKGKIARVFPPAMPYEIDRTSVHVLFQKTSIK